MAEMIARDNQVLDVVRGLVTQKVFEEIEAELNNSGAVYNFKIVDKAHGAPEDFGFSLGDIFVEQSTGPCGDDHSGSICFPLPDGRFMQCEFDC